MTHARHHILFVGKEPEDSTSFFAHLENEGLRVETLPSGEEALEWVAKMVPEVIVMEIILPGLDGVETCRRMRDIPALKDTLIIFLTERAEDYSQIAAFQAGADDYLVRPIRARVFATRVKALLSRIAPQKSTFSAAPPSSAKLVIDTEGMVVIKNGEKVQWQNKEFKLLQLLSSNPGKVFSREEILDKLWEPEEVSNDRIIDVYIRRIREKIGKDYIKTIIGRGYKFENGTAIIS